MLPVMLQGCILKVTLMLHFSIAALGLSEKRVITLLLLLQAMLSSLWGAKPEVAVSPGQMKQMFLRSGFDEVVDAQSVRYEVPVVVLECIVKPVKSFFKCIALVMDEFRRRMWCEAIGAKADMEQLQQKLKPGALMCFRALCFKKSVYHSGGKYIDLTKKQNVKVELLAPTDPAYVALQKSVSFGPGDVGSHCRPDDVGTGKQSRSTDLLCKICDLNVRVACDQREPGLICFWQF